MNRKQTFKKIDKALSELPALYGTENMKGDRPAVYLFTPSANATWVVWEYDPATNIGFGYCDLGFGMGELGYVDISGVKSAVLPFGLWVEIDRSVSTMTEGYRLAGETVPHYLMEKEAS